MLSGGRPKGFVSDMGLGPYQVSTLSQGAGRLRMATVWHEPARLTTESTELCFVVKFPCNKT